MSLAIRQMTPGDLPATFDVRLSTVENAITMERLERDYGVTPERLADAMTRDVKGWLCEDADTAVGFAMGNAASAEVLEHVGIPTLSAIQEALDALAAPVGWAVLSLVVSWAALHVSMRLAAPTR